MRRASRLQVVPLALASLLCWSCLAVGVSAWPTFHANSRHSAVPSPSTLSATASALTSASPALPYPTSSSLPSRVYELEFANRSTNDQLLLSSLQGALAQIGLSSPSNVTLLYRVIHATPAGTDDDSDLLFLDYYQRHFRTVAFDRSSLLTAPLRDVLQTVGGQLTGYVLTQDVQTGSGDAVRVAISLAGVTRGAIVACAEHAPLLKQLGIPLLRDARPLTNETAFLLSYAPFNRSSAAPAWPFHRRFFASQISGLAATYLTDYVVMNGLVMVNHIPSAQLILDHIQQPQGVFCVWMGWVPDGEWEDFFLHNVTRAGGGVWAMDTAANFATHAFFPAPQPLRNPTRWRPPAPLPDNRAKHTVAFLWTDGDSLCADQHGLADSNRWGSPARGRAPMSFSLDSSLAHMAPGVLGWYYETVRSRNDSLVAFAPAYTYPDELEEGLRWQWGALAAEAMAAADVGVDLFIGFNYSAVYAEPLLAQWNVEGRLTDTTRATASPLLLTPHS